MNSIFPDLKELKKLRNDIGLSQKELADRVGVSQSAITKYENGSQVPNYNIASRIFEELFSMEKKNKIPVKEIVQSQVTSVSPEDTLQDAISLMKNRSISQIPVMDRQNVIGTITEKKLLSLLDQYNDLSHFKSEKVVTVMDDILPIIPATALIEDITQILQHYDAVMVCEFGNIIGIISKADLIYL